MGGVSIRIDIGLLACAVDYAHAFVGGVVASSGNNAE